MEGRKMTEVDALGAWKPEEKDGRTDEELWSLDMTFTDFILPRITAFRKMKRHGYPVYEPLGTEDRVSEEEWKSIEERSVAEWENILFDIEKGFEAHQKIVAGEFSSRSHEARAEETMHKGMQLFAKHYFHLWD